MTDNEIIKAFRLCHRQNKAVLVGEIDNLVKEMVGENNAPCN